MESKLFLFNIPLSNYVIKPFGSGHINNTYLVSDIKNYQQYILQKINTKVFPLPKIIADNIAAAADYLALKHPDYLFIKPIKTKENNDFLKVEEEYWRLTEFIPDSASINTVEFPEQAYEAAKAFALLTKNLDGLNTAGLKPSIKSFHDLGFRFKQFEEALDMADLKLKRQAQAEIDFYLNNKALVNTYIQIMNNSAYPTRLIHHDTKINNVLFSGNKSLCVCDLDTLMPGKIISDLGDMMRTYLCAESEESTNFDAISIRIPIFEATIKGYLETLGSVLSIDEKRSLFYAGEFMIYMQGLRFLTDYLNGNLYYPVNHVNHNLVRAKNQRLLLMDYQKRKNNLQIIIDAALKNL